jgi:putative ABC transport system substrate-binding protein
MRVIGLVLALCLAPGPVASASKQAGKVYRVGWLSAGSAEVDESLVAGFRRGLRELGYVEGAGIVLEQRYAAGQPDRLPDLAGELVGRKPDIILASGDQAALATKKATSTIPIVVHVADALGTGLVSSLAYPRGNVTGVSDLHADLISKRLELLKQCVPALSRAAFLTNPTNPTCALQAKDVEAAAPGFGVTVLSLGATRAEDIDQAFATMKKERSQVLIVCGDRTLGTHRGQIFKLASNGRLPAMYSNRRFVEAGGLMRT